MMNDRIDIAEINLDAIKMKLMHRESGENWSPEHADAVEREYRRFLYLMKEFPAEETAPSVEVDTFWHYHILDTMKYAADCERVFGYFLHHVPYLGMRGEDDMANRERAGARMREIYEQTFGVGEARQQALAARAAYCGSAVVEDNAYCGSARGAAYCGSARGAAYCGKAGDAAEVAYCGAAGKPAAFDSTAYCGAAGKPAAWDATAYCGSATQSARNTSTGYCDAGNTKAGRVAATAYRGVSNGPARSSRGAFSAGARQLNPG